MRVHGLTKVILLSIFGVLPLSAMADTGLYVAASVGTADLDEDFDGLAIDSGSTAFRVLGGWSFNDHFSLELGYQGFGNFRQQLVFNGLPVTVGLSADGYTFGASGRWPVSERISILGRAGMFFWDGSAEINGVSQADPEDSNPYFGLGATYALTERLRAVLDYNRFDLEDAHSNLFSLGFQYHFD